MGAEGDWAGRDRRELAALGSMLDRRVDALRGRSVGVFLAEHLLRVRGKAGTLLPLKPNAAQVEYELRRGKQNIVLKARQMGMTTWVAGRFLLKTITRPGTLTLQVAHTRESAEEILRIVHRFVEYLPAGLRAGALVRSKSSVRQIVFPAMDSEYRVESAADKNAGRGLTVQNLHCSEVSRWPGDAAETLAGLRAGLAPGAELVLESTPNGAGGAFYEEWQGADATGLVRHFFPWWLDAGYRGAPVAAEKQTDEERALVAWAGLDPEQIGFRRTMRANLRGLARQEMVEDAESCFRVSGEPYFDLEALEKRLLDVPEPLERRDNGQLEIWLPALKGREYVVAVDPAGGGVDGDYSVIEVLDLESGMQCAEYAGHVTGRELAEQITKLCREYERSWVVVERNNHGAGILWLLKEGEVRVFHGRDGVAGWLTSSLSRPAMLARLGAMVAESPWLILSRKLLVECRSFVRLANGGMAARSGAHDDRVMAMAVGLAARAEMAGQRS